MTDYYETAGYGYRVTDTGDMSGKELGRFATAVEAKSAVKAIRAAHVLAVVKRAHEANVNPSDVGVVETIGSGYVLQTARHGGKTLGRFAHFKDARRAIKAIRKSSPAIQSAIAHAYAGSVEDRPY